ncbi:MAG TPA: hypothetical protein VMS87_09170, partial [Roseiarcus sp.]|nr:hypothetical protein [Roseiarcus sp.]
RAEVKRTFHHDIPVRERGEWEAYLKDNAEQVRSLSNTIAEAEREIDARVYSQHDPQPRRDRAFGGFAGGPILTAFLMQPSAPPRSIRLGDLHGPIA